MRETAIALLGVSVVALAFADRVPNPNRRWPGLYPRCVIAASIVCLVVDAALLARFDPTTAVTLGAAGLVLAWAARRRSAASRRLADQLQIKLHRLEARRRRHAR